jgi:hypothetical protein
MSIMHPSRDTVMKLAVNNFTGDLAVTDVVDFTMSVLAEVERKENIMRRREMCATSGGHHLEVKGAGVAEMTYGDGVSTMKWDGYAPCQVCDAVLSITYPEML